MKRYAFALLAVLTLSVFAHGLIGQTFGKDLLINGDAESGAASSGSTPVTSIPGWTLSGGPNVIAYTGSGPLGNSTIGPASRGKNYFIGTNTAKGILTQKIEVSAAAAGIDAGTVSYDASSYLGGANGDTSSMIVTFQGATGNTISSFTLGPIKDADKADTDALYFRRKLGQAPAGTRTVAVEIDLIRSSGSSNYGCADNISFLLNNDASAPSGFFGSNLIVNGNAELPSGIQLPSPLQSIADSTVLDLPGWVRSADFSLDVYSDESDLAATDLVPTDRGSWYSYGGGSNSQSNATQDIDIAASATQIDGGKVTFAFSAWVGGYDGQDDNITITAQFMNWAGSVLSTSTLGPVRSAERGGVSALLQKSQTGAVPAGARLVRITMTSNCTDGSDNDGLADSLSLVLTAPNAAGNAPVIQSGGVLSASAFGGSSSIAPGTWIEIYGSNLAGSTREWAGSDFSGSTAPRSLDGTSVTIAGQKAFIRYISPGQVNAQVPSNISPGPQQVTVSTNNGTSALYSITVNATQAGVLAPPLFMLGGKQYVAALHADGTFVLPPNAIAGVSSKQAQPGETILVYGIGFGSVTPDIAAGQSVGVANQLALPLQIQFGSTAASLSYAGLAPNFIGLYQFNVVVPNISDSDLVPFSVNLGGTPGSQTLCIAVKR
jgi:uncharacterized protein (TIGR03437 family)